MNACLYVAKSRIDGAGRGVFTMIPFAKGDVVEVCHVLVFDAADEPAWAGQYAYLWTETQSAIAFGYGSLYNHSHFCNLEYAKDVKTGVIVFTASRDIARGEELTIDYHEHYGTMEFDEKYEERFEMYVERK